MMRCLLIIGATGVLLAPLGGASNPLHAHVGMADPHLHIFNDTAYIYSTHDEWAQGSHGLGGCCTGDWWVWRSDDLISWTNVSHLHDWAWDPHPGQNWATDAAYKDGSYYWYVSMAGDTVAVAKGPSPRGPWSDPLGKPLLDAALGKSLSPPAGIRDPGVLQDDDGKNYLVFGSCGGPVQPDDCCYYASELGADMTSIQHPVHLSVHGALGPYGPGKCDDKPFLHKHNSTYYLSWGGFYATAASPMGPYEYRGSVIAEDGSGIAEDFLIGNLTKEPWYTREIFADRHGSFRGWKNQWYWVCNDRSHSDARKLKGESGFRDTSGSYVHYRADGSIAPVVIDAVGIGQYEASLGRAIEAENYFELVPPGAKLDLRAAGGGDGFAVGQLRVGSVLRYPNVRGVPRGETELWLRVAAASASRRRRRQGWKIGVFNSTAPTAPGRRRG
jgi:arabinoxylan arabinofuranohydrolase